MGRPLHPAKATAISNGLVFYFTGEPCVLGNIAERTVSENKCQCDAHKAKRATNARKRYLRDRKERIEKAAQWAENNVDAKKRAARDWASRNSHKVKAQTHKRRAAKLKATPAWFGELDEFVVQEAHDLARTRNLDRYKMGS